MLFEVAETKLDKDLERRVREVVVTPEMGLQPDDGFITKSRRALALTSTIQVGFVC